ncbi:pumilio/PUF RNA binding protein 8, putative [Trypanosoma brucei brucei TREU927]|uniref:Pumilio/PUF RNA binding protein 8, putative n=1 Tax=Trypanosoma brucei brucei (strain 927/4 GUTat10.1) TaxID=185431 RepID=Q582W0_TRYB2|nr:pumilio/PUF RNA binding protein 8, putative [Trypanosoma brucei brucei TREU927]AAX80729.1 pumilio/PUF RNA binding protein 8, putative [Trypanosoma brucei]AAZ10282.1 pumilio/PUF RNA binding protein 8, putative [Trypanosoma brucei brucei TREU927]
MGKTNTKKQEARVARLRSLPKSERLVKIARIKKREGRILDSAEKHALKMSSEYGEIIRLWEVLRTSEGQSKEEEEKEKQKKKGKNKKGEDSTDDVKQQKLSRYKHKYPTVDKLLKKIEPKFDTYVRTPRTSRVIQSMIKYGSTEQLGKIVGLISSGYANYATDAYGHFVVVALLRHAPHDLFDKILSLTIPAVPTLISHRFGIEVIHSAYSSNLCTATNRNLLILAVFKDNIALMKRWKGYPILEDVLAQEVEQRKRLLPKLFELCEKLVSQKSAVDFPFVQRLAAAFIRNGTKHEVSELCDTLRPHLAVLCTIREGAPLASLAFSLTEPKKRKVILRAFSENLGVLVVSKYSAPVIARLFDIVYDVQLLCKYVVNDVVSHITQLINSPFGHQILLHLLTPHDERKTKFLLPNWFQHNLYSVENTRWNCHTWLTHEYKEEEVELCSKDAEQTHLAVLPTLIKKFLEVLSNSEVASKLNKHYVGLIAREVLHVHEKEPAYRKALKLSANDVQVLERLSLSRGKKEPRHEEGGNSVGKITSEVQNKTKGRRLERPQMQKPAETPRVVKKMMKSSGVERSRKEGTKVETVSHAVSTLKKKKKVLPKK